MGALPRLSVTDRARLKALKLEQSQVLPAGKVWFCQGRSIVTRSNLSLMSVAVVVPGRADTLCVAAADYEAVKGWIG